MESNIIAISPSSISDISAELSAIGVSARGIELMKEKMLFHVIKIEKVDTRAANIIKQTMLSQGAEAAVSSGTINLRDSHTDVIIGATVQQLRLGITRLKEQPWGLRAIALELEKQFLI
ncbi:MAG: dihydropteroate synthase [Anaerovibrio sp.]|uniref:dihydropteroate synthase n=1 Tax=Anaerovibrio sp. TaxID=1872532 RepID=UPI0025F52FD3|nr:dihydropteroate synthase [Anaerovibrio sp.]MCR5175889.1 dihydropteroate synthase [Anaerovibrio sp.]